MKAIDFDIPVETIEDIQKAIFNAIDATIKTCKDGDLTGGTISFEYKGARITCRVDMESN